MAKSRPFKHTSFVQALQVAALGFGQAFSREVNIRWQVGGFIIAFLIALLLGLSSIKIILIVLISVLVILLELINSAFEALADIIHPKYDISVKYAKDVMAAAVLAASVAAIIIGVWIFLPELLLAFE